MNKWCNLYEKKLIEYCELMDKASRARSELHLGRDKISDSMKELVKKVEDKVRSENDIISEWIDRINIDHANSINKDDIEEYILENGCSNCQANSHPGSSFC